MRKRISCKVISTIPFSSNIDELRHKNRSNDRSHNINNGTRIPKTNVRETITNPQVKDFSKSVVYTHRMNIKRIPIDNGFTALNINFYA
ncbi:MAG: hypothetical protein GY845_34035 [Planctomycetes bacterium]|nr:hypothetical protein [Planctomycetota bacterium]